MADFPTSFELILEHEGGYTDNPIDYGGATNFGITLSTLAQVKGLGVTKDDVKALTQEQAGEIYRNMYWLPLQLASISVQIVADVLFDQSVLCGLPTAVKRSQLILSRMGRPVPFSLAMNIATVNSINSVDPHVFCLEFIIESQNYLAGSVTNNPAQIVFMRGWLHRTQDLLRHCFSLN